MLALCLFVAVCQALGSVAQQPIRPVQPVRPLKADARLLLPYLVRTSPNQSTLQAESIFSGIVTFASLPYQNCLVNPDVSFDIGFIGLPFDSGSGYRPGAPFGPSGIRQGSCRLRLLGGYNVPLATNPYTDWATVLDCGDIPVTSYDKSLALYQIEQGYHRLLTASSSSSSSSLSSSNVPHLIALGGDHTVMLPILRALKRTYGPVAVVHFGNHLGTWNPKVFGGNLSETAGINHETYLYHAAQEGLLADTNIHAGIRSSSSSGDNCGFTVVEARDIDKLGIQGVVRRIIDRVGTDQPVYLSIDIGTLDPAYAPATGSPETGGWSTRELRAMLRALTKLNIVGADLVEVAPAYDTAAEKTGIAAADLLYEVMTVVVIKGRV